jgi:heterodisulfide reductase subunit D
MTSDSTETTIAIRPSYTSLFENGRILGDLLKRPGFDWVTEPRNALKGADWVIHQSCNAAFTPFIADVVQQALRLTGMEVPVIGGSESCCGEFHFIFGDPDLGEIAARKAQQAFSIARPKTVVSVCPDCDSVFDKKALPNRRYANANISVLLADMLPVLVPLMKPVHRRVILHAHHHTPFAHQDADNVRRIVGAIPGIEIVEAARAEGPGLHCQTTKPMPPAAQAEMFAEAQALGVDAVVVPYHSCYRQHCKMELTHGVQTLHYIGLVGQSLGLEVFEEFKRLRLMDDIDAVTSALLVHAPAGRVSFDSLRRMVARSIFC